MWRTHIDSLLHFFPLYGTWGSISSGQTWHHVPLSSEPRHCFSDCFNLHFSIAGNVFSSDHGHLRLFLLFFFIHFTS